MDYRKLYDRYVHGEYPRREGCLPLLIGVLVALLTSVLLCSCRGQRLPVVLPSQHSSLHQRDSQRSHATGHANRQRDGLHVKERVVIRQMHDTVYRDSIIVMEIWRERIDSFLEHDTVLINDSIHVRDSIPYPVEVEKEVTVRSDWDRFCTRWTLGSWGVLVLLVIAGVVRLAIKLRTGL